MRRHAIVLIVSALLGSAGPSAQTLPPSRVLTHREQAPLKLRWVEQRFKTLLPALMRRTGIDMWIIVSREYNDDPVFASMAPVTTYSSRRRTILVFFDRGGAMTSSICQSAVSTTTGCSRSSERTTTDNGTGCAA
jgi:hypothetical protein